MSISYFVPTSATFDNATLDRTSVRWLRVLIDTDDDDVLEDVTSYVNFAAGVAGGGKSQGRIGVSTKQYNVNLRNDKQWFSEGDFANAKCALDAKIGENSEYIRFFAGYVSDAGAKRKKDGVSQDTVSLVFQDASRLLGNRTLPVQTIYAGFTVCDPSAVSQSLFHSVAAIMGLTGPNFETFKIDYVKDFLPLDGRANAWKELQLLNQAYAGHMTFRYDGKLRFISQHQIGYVDPSIEWTLDDFNYVNVHNWIGEAKGVECNRARTEVEDYVSLPQQVVHKNMSDFNTETGKNELVIPAGAYWPGGTNQYDKAQVKYKDPRSGETFVLGFNIQTPTIGVTGSGSDIECDGDLITLSSFNGSDSRTRQGPDYSELILYNNTGGSITITNFEIRGTPVRKQAISKVEDIDATVVNDWDYVDKDIPGKYMVSASQAHETTQKWVEWGKIKRDYFAVKTDWLPQIQEGAIISFHPDENINMSAVVEGYSHDMKGKYTQWRTTVRLKEYASYVPTGVPNSIREDFGEASTESLQDIEEAMTFEDYLEGFDDPGTGGTTTPSPPTISYCEAVSKNSIMLIWTRDTLLTNFLKYQIEVSEDEVTWYQPRQDGVDWKGAINVPLDNETTMFVHSSIPPVEISAEETEGRTLYYRVRTVTKASEFSAWSDTASATTKLVEGGDLASNSVFANNLVAGVLNALIANINESLQIGDEGFLGSTSGQDPPTEGTTRCRLDRNELIIEYYNGTAWETIIKAGGDEAGGFFPWFQARGLIRTGAISEVLGLDLGVPIDSEYIYQWEASYGSYDGVDHWDIKKDMAFYTAYAKFGSYGIGAKSTINIAAYQDSAPTGITQRTLTGLDRDHTYVLAFSDFKTEENVRYFIVPAGWKSETIAGSGGLAGLGSARLSRNTDTGNWIDRADAESLTPPMFKGETVPYTSGANYTRSSTQSRNGVYSYEFEKQDSNFNWVSIFDSEATGDLHGMTPGAAYGAFGFWFYAPSSGGPSSIASLRMYYQLYRLGSWQAFSIQVASGSFDTWNWFEIPSISLPSNTKGIRMRIRQQAGDGAGTKIWMDDYTWPKTVHTMVATGGFSATGIAGTAAGGATQTMVATGGMAASGTGTFEQTIGAQAYGELIPILNNFLGDEAEALISAGRLRFRLKTYGYERYLKAAPIALRPGSGGLAASGAISTFDMEDEFDQRGRDPWRLFGGNHDVDGWGSGKAWDGGIKLASAELRALNMGSTWRNGFAVGGLAYNFGPQNIGFDYGDMIVADLPDRIEWGGGTYGSYTTIPETHEPGSPDILALDHQRLVYVMQGSDGKSLICHGAYADGIMAISAASDVTGTYQLTASGVNPRAVEVSNEVFLTVWERDQRVQGVLSKWDRDTNRMTQGAVATIESGISAVANKYPMVSVLRKMSGPPSPRGGGLWWEVYARSAFYPGKEALVVYNYATGPYQPRVRNLVLDISALTVSAGNFVSGPAGARNVHITEGNNTARRTHSYSASLGRNMAYTWVSGAVSGPLKACGFQVSGGNVTKGTDYTLYAPVSGYPQYFTIERAEDWSLNNVFYGMAVAHNAVKQRNLAFPFQMNTAMAFTLYGSATYLTGDTALEPNVFAANYFPDFSYRYQGAVTFKKSSDSNLYAAPFHWYVVPVVGVGIAFSGEVAAHPYTTRTYSRMRGALLKHSSQFVMVARNDSADANLMAGVMDFTLHQRLASWGTGWMNKVYSTRPVISNMGRDYWATSRFESGDAGAFPADPKTWVPFGFTALPNSTKVDFFYNQVSDTHRIPYAMTGDTKYEFVDNVSRYYMGIDGDFSVANRQAIDEFLYTRDGYIPREVLQNRFGLARSWNGVRDFWTHLSPTGLATPDEGQAADTRAYLIDEQTKMKFRTGLVFDTWLYVTGVTSPTGARFVELSSELSNWVSGDEREYVADAGPTGVPITYNGIAFTNHQDTFQHDVSWAMHVFYRTDEKKIEAWSVQIQHRNDNVQWINGIDLTATGISDSCADVAYIPGTSVGEDITGSVKGIAYFSDSPTGPNGEGVHPALQIVVNDYGNNQVITGGPKTSVNVDFARGTSNRPRVEMFNRTHGIITVRPDAIREHSYALPIVLDLTAGTVDVKYDNPVVFRGIGNNAVPYIARLSETRIVTAIINPNESTQKDIYLIQLQPNNMIRMDLVGYFTGAFGSQQGAVAAVDEERFMVLAIEPSKTPYTAKAMGARIDEDLRFTLTDQINVGASNSSVWPSSQQLVYDDFTQLYPGTRRAVALMKESGGGQHRWYSVLEMNPTGIGIQEVYANYLGASADNTGDNYHARICGTAPGAFIGVYQNSNQTGYAKSFQAGLTKLYGETYLSGSTPAMRFTFENYPRYSVSKQFALSTFGWFHLSMHYVTGSRRLDFVVNESSASQVLPTMAEDSWDGFASLKLQKDDDLFGDLRLYFDDTLWAEENVLTISGAIAHYSSEWPWVNSEFGIDGEKDLVLVPKSGGVTHLIGGMVVGAGGSRITKITYGTAEAPTGLAQGHLYFQTEA